MSIKKLKHLTDLTYHDLLIQSTINALIDKVDKLEKEIKYIHKFFFEDEKDGPGEIGWNGGEFYKD